MHAPDNSSYRILVADDEPDVLQLVAMNLKNAGFNVLKAEDGMSALTQARESLPALIVQREFDPRSFGVLVSLITAINQVTYAFGPGVIGLLRDLSGGYALPFYGCIALELIAAVLIMIRGRRAKT